LQLRWLAVSGQLATILGTQLLLGVRLPLTEMLSLLALLAAFNLACAWRSRQTDVGDTELFAGLLVDVAALSGQLYYAGGIHNPFIYLFLLQVAVGAVLLRPVHAWAIAALSGGAFFVLSFWYRPLDLEGRDDGALSLMFAVGLLMCFVLSAALIVAFIARIQHNLRQRDARLAGFRQRAAEERHILRMGLLASGAAHELGTPLATLSVIVGDWARMAPFTGEPELREEIEAMQQQIERCKSIVSGILMSAGEARAESVHTTTPQDFLEALLEDWQQSRPVHELVVNLGPLPERPIIADRALRQMLSNVLDNAFEASPETAIRFEAEADAEGDWLHLAVVDQGPGFAAEILEHLGTPYRSTKGRPGGGLGLFLAFNVVRTLGGQLQARNRPDGGAVVEIRLPLASLSPRQSGPDVR
jgi:two-component system sensor histidine kinase RegB